MKFKTYQQTIHFKASPERVFNAWLDEMAHAAFTGQTARIIKLDGAWFDTLGHTCFGYQLFLVKNQRIVQAWRHKDFPLYQYSVLNILLEEKPEGGTRMKVVHAAVPADWPHDWKSFFKENYWKGLKKLK